MKTGMFRINGNLIMAIALGFMTANAFASLPINFATGQDSSGNIQLIDNSLDANWKESNAVSPINPPNSYVVSPNNPDWYAGAIHLSTTIRAGFPTDQIPAGLHLIQMMCTAMVISRLPTPLILRVMT